MPPQSTAMRVDVNVLVGPAPTDAHAPWTADDVERHAERFGLSLALVRHTSSLDYDPAEGNRRLLAELSGRPRLAPCFVLGPLESGEHGPAAALPRALADARVAGVWLYPRRHGWAVHGTESQLLLKALRECVLPVFIDLDEADWAGVDLLASALPDQDIVVCGLGYRTLRQAVSVLDRRARVHVDLSYTASVDGLELLVERYGAQRVLLGTGAPIRDDAAPWFVLDRSELTAVDRAAVSGGNARRLLSQSTIQLTDRAEPATRAASADAPRAIVDAHGHLGRWPSSWLPRPDAAGLLAALQRTGTVHAVVSHMAALWTDTLTGNDDAIAAAASHPESLSVYVVANPNHPQDEDRLREQLRSPQVRGIKVHPDIHSVPLDDARFRWIWDIAEEHRVAVLAHAFGLTDHSDPYLFAAVAEQRPTLVLLVGHSGATVDGFRRTIEVAQGHPNLIAETCGSWMTGRWVRQLVDALGPERVVHGTDACLIDPRYGVGRVVGADLSTAERAAVLGGNARRIFNLP